MKTIKLVVSFLAASFSLTSYAETGVDAYYEYLQNPALLMEKADDPKAAEIQALLQSIAPEINFHSEEKFLPMDPNEFLDRSSLRRGSYGKSVEISGVGDFTAESLASLDSSYFLRLEGSRKAPLVKPAPLIWQLSGTPLVNQLPSRAGSRWVMIDFWFTTAYNEALFLFKLGDHQGEWEGQGFLVELSTDSEGKLQHRLGGAYYAHHMSGTWYCPSELEWTADSHPRAYSAHGSHASYASAGKYPRRGGLLGNDHTNGNGSVLRGWEYIRPLVLEPYYGFLGGWGNRGIMSAMNGPDGPNSTKFYPREKDEKSLNRMAADLQNRCAINSAEVSPQADAEEESN